MKIKQLHFFLLLFLGVNYLTQAQQSFSLKEAVSYAVKNHLTVKNAQIDIINADARVHEIKAAGLPQVNGSLVYTGNIRRPGFVLPAEFGGGGFARFGNYYAGSANANFSQMVFNGSYTLGLRAADVYKELSQKSLIQTKEQVAENVMKAYYSILVNEERIKILGLNIGRLDSTYRETKFSNEKGFVEKIDVQRLEVQLNNLKTELWKTQELQKLSYDLLKFQMGMEPTEVVLLKDKLSDISLNSIVPNQAPINYADRTDYSILETQRHLQELDLKNIKAGGLPTVSITGNYGYNATGNKVFFSDGVSYDISAVNLNINIPIFDGYARKYRAIQSKNTLDKLNNTSKLLENTITLQTVQANTTLKNGLESLNSQKRNMELAQEVVRVTKAKYQQGLGPNIEVVNAESSLTEAQTNYFASLYDVLIAKVDLDKALGKLDISQ